MRIPTNKGRDQRQVGKFIYFSRTCPNIFYAINVESQFIHSPWERVVLQTWSLENRVLYKCRLVGSVMERRYCTFVGGNLVTWSTKKQLVVGRSSIEAEFWAMAHGVCELLWLKTLLKELGYNYKDPMRLYCDSKAIINIVQSLTDHDRTKHIEFDWHSIKEKLHTN
jgi:hypothetical protein